MRDTADFEAATGIVAAFSFLVVTAAVIQFLVLGLSAGGVTITGAIAVGIIGGAASVGGALASCYLRNGTGPGTPAPTSFTGGWPLRILAVLVGAWTIQVWVRLLILARRRPVYDWDGLYYHVPALNHWANAGRICWIDSLPDNPFVNYPMGMEALTFVLHRALGTSALLDACNLWYWPMFGLAIVLIADRLGVRGAARWLAAALLVGSPILLQQSVSCYTDAGFAAAGAAALAATMLLVRDHGPDRTRHTLLWACAIGLLLGTKGMGLPMACVLIATTATILVRRARGTVSRRATGPILACLAIIMAVGGYWYVRNTIATGNPIHPVEVAVGEKVIFAGYPVDYLLRIGLPGELAAVPRPLRLPYTWISTLGPVTEPDDIGGMGWLWVTVCVPALLALNWWAMRRRGSPAAGTALLLSGISIAVLIIHPEPSWSRTTIWLLAPGLPAVLWAWQGAASRHRLTATAILLLPIILAVWESDRTLQAAEAKGRLTDADGNRTYMSSREWRVPGLEATPGLDAVLSETRLGRTRWGRVGTHLGGTLSLPLGERRLILLSPVPDAAELATLRRAGVRWLVWDTIGAGAIPEAVRAEVRREIVYREFHFLLIAGDTFTQ